MGVPTTLRYYGAIDDGIDSDVSGGRADIINGQQVGTPTTHRCCGAIDDGIDSDVGGGRAAIIWNERSAQLASWCVSYDEDSLISRNEPLEYSDLPTCKCMDGGES